MSLRYGLLGLLNYGSMTGYELGKAFEASISFFWQAKASQIYRELNAMERHGWLTSERIIQNEKPNKRVYSISAQGREALSRWLSSPAMDISDAMRVRSAFLMRIFFAGEMSTEQSLAILRTYREKCRADSKEMGAAHAAIAEYGAKVGDDRKTLYWKITLLYGELFRQAGLDWADRAIALLEQMQQKR